MSTLILSVTNIDVAKGQINDFLDLKKMRSIPLENEIELKYKVFTYGSADDKPRKIKNIIFLSIIFIKFYSNDQIQILGLGFHDLIRSHHHEIHEFFITTFLSIQENGCNTNN